MLTTFETVLETKQKLTDDVYLFRFRLVRPDKIVFLPGQYLIADIPQKNNQSIKRLYSIASSPDQTGRFDLIIKIVEKGLGGSYLMNLDIGRPLLFQGPAGAFTLKNTDRSKVFLATGTGIAPIKSMIASIKNFEYKIKSYLFWGLPYISEVFMAEELKEMEKSGNFSFDICLSRETDLGEVAGDDKKHFTLGRIDKGLDDFFLKTESFKDYEYYICGNPGVVESIRQYLFQKGIDTGNIFSEKF